MRIASFCLWLVLIGAASLGWAASDQPLGVRLAQGAGPSYRVLYTSAAYVTDAAGRVLRPITAKMDLFDDYITVDVGGVLFLESANEDGGYIEVFQNSSFNIDGSKIGIKTGEMVIRTATALSLLADDFEVQLDKDSGNAYLFARGIDSFFSLDRKASPARVKVGASAEITMEPGFSILINGTGEPEAHRIVPRTAKRAMKRLEPAIRYIKSEKKSGQTLRVLHADQVEVAVPSAAGREFRKVTSGEMFVLQPEFAPLTLKLGADASVLAVESVDTDGKKELYNFSGKLLFELAGEYTNGGG